MPRFPRLLPLTATAAALLLSACASQPGEAPGAVPRGTAEAAVQSAQWSLAQSHEQRFEYDRAATLYGQILSENPDDPTAAVAYARNLRYAGKLDMAQEVARIALDRMGPVRELRLEQVKAMLAAGRVRAVRPLAVALAADDPQDWQGHSLLGLVLDAAGQSADALAEHRTAHTLRPDHPQAINNLALAEAAAGNLAQGLALLEPAAGDPRAPLHLRMNLALLYMLDNQPRKAEALVRANLPPEAVEGTLDTLAQFRGRPGLARDRGRLTPGYATGG